MIVFQWIFNALFWVKNAIFWLFQTCFIKESTEQVLIKHIESQALLIENSHRICCQLIEVLCRQKQEREYKVPVVKSILKSIVPYCYKNSNEFNSIKHLTEYLLQCLRINGTTISWTNEYGVDIVDSDLKILAYYLREASLESDMLENIHFFLNDLVLLTKEGQKILRECIPLSDDVFRFVLLKYL